MPTASRPFDKKKKSFGAEGKALFTNLFCFSQSFRDHNFNNSFGYLSKLPGEFIEGQFQRLFPADARPPAAGEYPDPYLEETLRYSLSSGSCGSFFRTNPELPIDERDYYLSKLFQYIWAPLQARFELPVNRGDEGYYFFEGNSAFLQEERFGVNREAGTHLELLLNTIPSKLLPSQCDFDWYAGVLLEIFYDSMRYDLKEVLKRLQTRLRTIVSRKAKLPTQSAPSETEFTHSPDYRSVSIGGKKYLLSPAQASIIQVLHEAWTTGHPDLGVHYVIERAGYTASRIQDFFKGNPTAYKELITPRKRGMVRLNLPDPE